MSDDPDMDAQSRSKRWLLSLPVLIFCALSVLFLIGLFAGDPSKLPSALIGKPAPALSLPAIPEVLFEGKAVPGFEAGDLAKGRVTLVNVWASWCPPCRDEHPILIALSRDKRFQIVGLNQKDKPENARRFLNALGNPFSAIGSDITGRASIEWGVYGAPETFIVDGQGIIRFKFVGPLSPADMPAFMAQVEAAFVALDRK